MIIGKRIKLLRIQKRLSQEELGNYLGVTKVSVCGYEKGKRVPNADNLEKLANFFGVSIDYLYGRANYVVCESDNSILFFSDEDIKIIETIKQFPEIYNLASLNPLRLCNFIDRKIK